MYGIDFEENYSFIFQKVIWGHHGNSIQAALHPFIIYVKDENNELNNEKCMQFIWFSQM